MIGAVVIDILAAKFRLTCPSLRLLATGEERKPFLSDTENEVVACENTLLKSDDGRGFENMRSRSSSCSSTQSKKDDFNSFKVVSGPIYI